MPIENRNRGDFVAAKSASRWLFLFTRALLALFCVSCGGQDSGERVDATTSALCSRPQLSADVTQLQSGVVTLTAGGSACDGGERPDYLFHARRQGATLPDYDLAGWSANTTIQWNVSGIPSGIYQVTVRPRPHGGGAPGGALGKASVFVGEVCNAVTLEATNVPVSPGSLVDMIAAASCSGGTPEYQFTAVLADKQALELRGWGPVPTFRWDSAEVPPGPHTLLVNTRRRGNAALEATASVPFTVGESCGALSGTISGAAGPVSAGTPVTVNVNGSCSGGSVPEYRFNYRDGDTSHLTVFRDWSIVGSATLDTTGLAANNYTIRAEIRQAGAIGPAPAHKNFGLVVGGLCGAVTLDAASPPGVINEDPTLVLSAAANCVVGTPEYKFSYAGPGDEAFTALGDYSTASELALPAAAWTGQFRFLVQARASGSSAPSQSQAILEYELGAACTVDSFSATRADSRSDEVTLTASASCLDDSSPEFQFSVRASGAGAWQTLDDFASSGQKVITLSRQTNYELQVTTRSAARAGAAKN